MKISILSFDLAHNCLGRAYLLGKVLSRRYDVDIHGFIFPSLGSTIWKPCDTGEFHYQVEVGKNFPGFCFSAASLLKNISGDVIYACKPKLPSFGLALLKKFFSRIPVILDIDDIETSWYHKDGWNEKPWSIIDPIGRIQTEWMEHFIKYADDITVVSSQLNQKYKRGIIVPHGRDTTLFNPDRFDRKSLRKEFNVERIKVIMFLGTPRPHKGLEIIIEAMKILGREDIRLFIVGKGSDLIYEKRLMQLGGEKVVIMDQIAFNEIPQYLTIADLIVIPQKQSVESYAQIPAKVYDAMAMAKPVIATNVSDLPIILENVGMIVEPDDIEGLASKIEWIFSHPADAYEMGMKARKKCIDNYSWDVMDVTLSNILNKYI